MKNAFLFVFLLTFSSFAQETIFLGGIVRGDTTEKKISLVFTSHEFIDGFEIITSVLKKHDVKGSFFFTGDFYRTPEFRNVIISLKNSGHYLGAHSDKHILYCSWEMRDSTLVSRDEFFADVLNNYAEMEKFGIKREEAEYYLPPYEWYNQQISQWTKELGLILINFTPGTSSNQDWTIPSLNKQYISSDTIYNRIMEYEEKNETGLNGFILLTHFGTHPERIDKFYFRLDELISSLKQKGYKFHSVNELLN